MTDPALQCAWPHWALLWHLLAAPSGHSQVPSPVPAPKLGNRLTPYLNTSLQHPHCEHSYFHPILRVCSQTGQTRCHSRQHHPSKWGHILAQSVRTDELQQQTHSSAAYKPLPHRPCPSSHHTQCPTGPVVSPPLSQHSVCHHPPASPPQHLQALTQDSQNSAEPQHCRSGGTPARVESEVPGWEPTPLQAVPGAVQGSLLSPRAVQGWGCAVVALLGHLKPHSLWHLLLPQRPAATCPWPMPT